jgi:PadR family transcriptional regulator, regulatory protein PadR
MVLRTLSALGPQHGYGIARRIEQVSGDQLILNQGTIYISLVRLQERGRIRSKWGVSENNRRARFYSITKAGEKQLAAQTETWEQVAAVMGRVLAAEGSEGDR